jgi:hypothetical protein
VNRVEGEPVVFYLHPWEIDPEQPRLKVRRALRVRHYGGLRQTPERLRRLIRDFRFDCIMAILKGSAQAGHVHFPSQQTALSPVAQV